MTGENIPWYSTRRGTLALTLLAALPLLWLDIPPLVDLPGHMARYRVQLDLHESEALQRYFDYHWAWVGNLGIDLLIVPMAKLFGLELGVKLIILAIPPITVAGFLSIAREVHGRVPPTALFAIPFAYGYPFHFGFVNFALSMAFALLAFGVWLRLARLGHPWLRAALFVPISALVWLTHTFGWGTLGVLAFSAELIRQHDRIGGWIRAAFRSGIHCLSLTPPLMLMLAWRSGATGGDTGDWFNLTAKMYWVTNVLRDRWWAFDVASLIVVAFIIYAAFRNPKLTFSRHLGASSLFLLAVFLLLPRIIFGSAYADMRLVPYLFGVALVAIRFREGSEKLLRQLAAAGLAFVFVRTAGTTISFWLYDQRYDRELAAVVHVPAGARLLTFVGKNCGGPWYTPRLDHLSAIATVRRHAFTNDQWKMTGSNLLTVHYEEGRPFTYDPSQMTSPARCNGKPYPSLDKVLSRFPRRAFDYVWLIDPPPHDARLLAGYTSVWRSGTSVLYRAPHAPMADLGAQDSR